MKFIKKYEIFDKTITDGHFTIGDLVHIDDWNDAKILKVYDDKCLVEFLEDKYLKSISFFLPFDLSSLFIFSFQFLNTILTKTHTHTHVN